MRSMKLTASDPAGPVFPLLEAGQRIRAVVFDLDGTLYPRRQVVRYLVRRLFPRIIRLKRYNDFRKSAAGRDFGSGEALMQAALDLYSSNPDKQRRYRQWLENHYFPALVAGVSCAALRPGFNTVVQKLKENGVKLAVVSDYGYVEERLAGLGCFPNMFDFLFGTETVGVMKPCQRINDIIVETLGVPESEILVVGDRADTDQALAERGGMHFIGVTDTKACNNTLPWLCWEQLQDGLLSLCETI